MSRRIANAALSLINPKIMFVSCGDESINENLYGNYSSQADRSCSNWPECRETFTFFRWARLTAGGNFGSLKWIESIKFDYYMKTEKNKVENVWQIRLVFYRAKNAIRNHMSSFSSPQITPFATSAEQKCYDST